MKHALLLFTLLIQGCLFGKGPRDTIDALIVYDNSPKNLKSAHYQDAIRMRSIIKKIASQTKQRLRMRLISSKGLIQKKISSWMLSSKTPSKNVLFFYYSGQGLSASKSHSKRPAIGVKVRAKGEYTVLTEKDIAQKVQHRSPRLSIILFDCYDHFTKLPTFGLSIEDLSVGISKKDSLKGFRNLFLQSKGTITASSAVSPDSATGIGEGSPYGGLFTTKFLSVLRDAKQEATWDQVMQLVSYYCRYDRFSPQSPVINVQVGTDEATKTQKKK